MRTLTVTIPRRQGFKVALFILWTTFTAFVAGSRGITFEVRGDE